MELPDEVLSVVDVDAKVAVGDPPTQADSDVQVIDLEPVPGGSLDDPVAIEAGPVTAVVDRQTLIGVLKDSTEDGDG